MDKLEVWLDRCFGITGKTGNEVQFPCPKCHHASFFFNIIKRIGYCHRASCSWTPRIEDLNKHTRLQFLGNLVHERIDDNPTNTPRDVEIKMPECDLLVTKVDGELLTKYGNAVLEVDARGVSPEDQFRFKLGFNGIRVYVPVYYKGKLVNYVGRRAWWKDAELDAAGVPKYEYCKGAKTNDFIFNWDEMKLRPRLTFVENTFNGIWLMNQCDGTSNFGSSLSAVQVELLKGAKAKSVVFLWDEGAETRAAKACQKLQAIGIPAAFLKITRQPDNHSLEQLVSWSDFAHKCARLGKTQVNT